MTSMPRPIVELSELLVRKHCSSLNQVNFWSEPQKDTNLPGIKLATAKLIRANLGSANLCVVEFY